MCNSKYAAALRSSLPHSLTRSRSTPISLSASGRRTPFLSLRPRASSRLRLPEQADDPKRLFPKRAPSSSAQSTKRTVTGGWPAYWSLMRRRISTPARTFRQPSSHPPLGTESRWPPMSSARSERPRKVVQVLPAASLWISTGRASNFCLSQARAASQVLVKATRWAPFSSPVRARSSFSSTTVRLGFRDAYIRFRTSPIWQVNVAVSAGDDNQKRLRLFVVSHSPACHNARHESGHPLETAVSEFRTRLCATARGAGAQAGESLHVGEGRGDSTL